MTRLSSGNVQTNADRRDIPTQGHFARFP